MRSDRVARASILIGRVEDVPSYWRGCGWPSAPGQLHYPNYCYYDVLSAAKGLAEAGLLIDDRCQDGLDLLESKAPTGRRPAGRPAEGKYYNPPGARGQAEIVDWGGASARKTNPWVTADALTVLHAAGRI